jgi:hyperosmotically inducible protein
MNRIIPYIAVAALAAAGLTGCNKGPGANTAYNNSGSSAAPGSTTTTTTTSTSTDTSSPATATTAATPSSDATGTNVVADTATTGKIKAAIATDPGLKDTEIIVKTDGGIVVLSGTAKSQDQVQIASNLAQRQEGVNRVETQIVVR